MMKETFAHVAERATLAHRISQVARARHAQGNLDVATRVELLILLGELGAYRSHPGALSAMVALSQALLVIYEGSVSAMCVDGMAVIQNGPRVSDPAKQVAMAVARWSFGEGMHYMCLLCREVFPTAWEGVSLLMDYYPDPPGPGCEAAYLTATSYLAAFTHDLSGQAGPDGLCVLRGRLAEYIAECRPHLPMSNVEHFLDTWGVCCADC